MLQTLSLFSANPIKSILSRKVYLVKMTQVLKISNFSKLIKFHKNQIIPTKKLPLCITSILALLTISFLYAKKELGMIYSIHIIRLDIQKYFIFLYQPDIWQATFSSILLWNRSRLTENYITKKISPNNNI